MTPNYFVAGILNVSLSNLEKLLIGWTHQRNGFSSSESNVYYACAEVTNSWGDLANSAQKGLGVSGFPSLYQNYRSEVARTIKSTKTDRPARVGAKDFGGWEVEVEVVDFNKWDTIYSAVTRQDRSAESARYGTGTAGEGLGGGTVRRRTADLFVFLLLWVGHQDGVLAIPIDLEVGARQLPRKISRWDTMPLLCSQVSILDNNNGQ